MAVRSLPLPDFLERSNSIPILDVRSPGEYAHAHIPGAISFPLFTDEERKIVGTAYKQQSRETAIKIGLDFFGPKMRGMVETAEALKSKELLVHCWRGGMRSAGIAWLLDLYGFKIATLQGGYKVFRQYVVESFQLPAKLNVIAGYTGSGKTEILEKLKRLGEPVINLEKLAAHKGSTFGHLGLPEQPSQEQFENLLGLELRKYQGNIFWIEDESWRIGKVLIPQPFFLQLRKAPAVFIDIPFEKRLQFICKEYGSASREDLINAILRIQKRLGGLETKTAINHLIENNVIEAFRILLSYYDKWYQKALNSRPSDAAAMQSLMLSDVDADRNAQQLINL